MLAVTTRKWFWIAVAVIAGLIAAIQLPRAYAIYFHLGPFRNGPGQVDLHYRWQELHYVMRGKNPYDVAFARDGAAHTVQPVKQSLIVRDSQADPDLGVPIGVIYPPWAYPTELLFFSQPTRDSEAIFYAAVMAAGLVFVFWWTRSQVAGRLSIARIAVPLAVMAAASWVSGIVAGNNPLVIIPLLMLCYVALQHKKKPLAGVALGMALMKPSLAGPFLLVLLLRHRWMALATTVGYVALASLLTWYLTATSPIEMLNQMFAASRQWTGVGFGPLQYLISAGVRAQSATVITAIVVSAVGAGALWAIREGSLLAQFALAAIVARFWSYHLFYDDAVIIFALVFFARETLVSQTRAAYTGLILSCLGLWMPYRASLLLPLQIVQLLIWLTLAYLIVMLSRSKAAGPNAELETLNPSLAQPSTI